MSILKSYCRLMGVKDYTQIHEISLISVFPRMDKMHDLFNKKEEYEDLLVEEFFRSKSQKLSNEAKIKECKSKINDEKYVDHAIKKIATDLTHFLLK